MIFPYSNKSDFITSQNNNYTLTHYGHIWQITSYLTAWKNISKLFKSMASTWVVFMPTIRQNCLKLSVMVTEIPTVEHWLILSPSSSAQKYLPQEGFLWWEDLIIL